MATNELVIYKSSAGSGKTYTLVLEYLKLVLKKPTLYRSVLAITFTNKATEEMKSRIISALNDLAAEKNRNYAEFVSSHTGIPLNELQTRAEKALNYILHDYSGFAISTIDSFFSGLIRSLARELHLPLKFDLELNTGKVIKEISDQLLDEVGNDEWLRNWLREFTFELMDNDKGWKIDRELHKIARVLFDEKYRTYFENQPHRITKEFVGGLRKIKTEFEAGLRSIVQRFLKIIQQEGLTIDDFIHNYKGPAGFINKLAEFSFPNPWEPGVRFMNATENPAAWTSKTSPNVEKIIGLANRELVPLANEILRYFDERFNDYVSCCAVLNMAYLAGVTGALDEQLKIYREENDLILISDTNRMLNKVISDQDAPFIYEKTGNRYSHFMLDEFQDTSDFQWRNLVPLVSNALGEGNYVMLVGDAKQSIYRWRGGNMQLLLNGVEKNLRAFRSITRTEKLDSNFRSRENIVNFNNSFFTTAPSLLPYSDSSVSGMAYDAKEVTQNWKKGNAGEGYVKFSFFTSKKEDADEETGEITGDSDWKFQASEETLATINSLLEKGFEHRDIAILTRTNTDAQLITGHLIANGITRIISPESMQLYHSPKISLLIHLFRLIQDPEEEISLAYIVYYLRSLAAPGQHLSLHELFGSPLREKWSHLPEAFRLRRKEFRKLPLYELTEELTGIFGLNGSPDAYVQRFLDLLLEYLRNNSPSLRAFLEWWDENLNEESCSVILPSAENAIRVMSIHKSKGLQFPVVIIPFADWSMSPKINQTLWVQNEKPPFNDVAAHPVKFHKILQHSVFETDFNIETDLTYVDNLNLFYVAFTRAEEHLYVFSKKSGTANFSGSFLMQALQKLSRDECWKDTNDRTDFTLGTPLQPLNGPYQVAQGETLGTWISIPWKDRIKMGISKKKIALSDPDAPDTTYGILFHELLSVLSSVKDPYTQVSEFLLDRVEDAATAERLLDESGFFISESTRYGWFDPSYQILNEAELLLDDGTVIRPDRLLIRNDEVIVIDYKTGAEEKQHESQVRKYAAALQQMGYTKIEMYLVYSALKKSIAVSAA